MTTQEYRALDKKVDRILDHIEKQNDRNIETEGRLVKLEAGQHRGAKVATGVAAIATAVVNGLVLAMTGGRG